MLNNMNVNCDKMFIFIDNFNHLNIFIYLVLILNIEQIFTSKVSYFIEKKGFIQYMFVYFINTYTNKYI